MFPGQGAALMDAWRARQFQYQWLRNGVPIEGATGTTSESTIAIGPLPLTLADDGVVKVGGLALQAIATPGHTPGADIISVHEDRDRDERGEVSPGKAVHIVAADRPGRSLDSHLRGAADVGGKRGPKWVSGLFVGKDK